MSRLVAAFALGTLALVGCISAQGTTQTRAANDFQCPKDQIVVTNIGGTSFRAEGCGKTATYNCAASDASKGSTTAYACVPEAPPMATTSADAPSAAAK